MMLLILLRLRHGSNHDAFPAADIALLYSLQVRTASCLVTHRLGTSRGILLTGCSEFLSYSETAFVIGRPCSLEIGPFMTGKHGSFENL